MPSEGFSQLSIINNSPCTVQIEAADIAGIPAFNVIYIFFICLFIKKIICSISRMF